MKEENIRQRCSMLDSTMLDSTIEDLMKEVSDVMVEPEMEDLGLKESVKQDPEAGSNIVVCGIIPTSSGRISVVRPKDMLPKAGTVEGGLAKLQALVPRLLKGKVNLATVIEVTRLPPTLVVKWVQSLQLSLPPE